MFNPGGLIDIGTHMSFCRLSTGKFLVIDTCAISVAMKTEIDSLTDGGKLIEAVIATHPFHTLFFMPFYKLYPNVQYYGTPRHLRNITALPWAGNIDAPGALAKWEPDISLRIPDGAEFVNPVEENHFSCVFVFHKDSKTIHCDDTIMYFDGDGVNALGCCVKCFFKAGSMSFHPTLKDGIALYPTSEAPTLLQRWMEGIIRDWDFQNICAAHNGIKIGDAKEHLIATLHEAGPLLEKLAKTAKK